MDIRKIEYNYKELDKDFTREEMLEVFPTAKTYPQVKINNQQPHQSRTPY